MLLSETSRTLGRLEGFAAGVESALLIANRSLTGVRH